jgi:hypothetical protein
MSDPEAASGWVGPTTWRCEQCGVRIHNDKPYSSLVRSSVEIAVQAHRETHCPKLDTNAHDDLLAACKRLVRAARVDPLDVGFDLGAVGYELALNADDTKALCAAAKAARAAIAKAKP